MAGLSLTLRGRGLSSRCRLMAMNDVDRRRERPAAQTEMPPRLGLARPDGCFPGNTVEQLVCELILALTPGFLGHLPAPAGAYRGVAGSDVGGIVDIGLARFPEHRRQAR